MMMHIPSLSWDLLYSVFLISEKRCTWSYPSYICQEIQFTASISSLPKDPPFISSLPRDPLVVSSHLCQENHLWCHLIYAKRSASQLPSNLCQEIHLWCHLTYTKRSTSGVILSPPRNPASNAHHFSTKRSTWPCPPYLHQEI